MGACSCRAHAAVCPEVDAALPPALEVSEKAREFFGMVAGFVAAKNEIDAIASAALPKRYMDAFPSFRDATAQARLDGSSDAGVTLREVYAAAERARPVFERVARRLVARAGLDPDARALHRGEALAVDARHAPGVVFTRLAMAPPKGEARAREKVENE